MNSPPKGQTDRSKAKKHHQFADEARCHKTEKLSAKNKEVRSSPNICLRFGRFYVLYITT
jgi:hypothetical protein